MASWQSRYAFEPFTEDLRNPSLPEGRSVVRIEPGSAQAARVLGGEGGCWGNCMPSGGRPEQLPWKQLVAISERLWSPTLAPAGPLLEARHARAVALVESGWLGLG